MTAIAKAGFDPHIHSIGDRAVRLTLDAYAYMRKRIGKAATSGPRSRTRRWSTRPTTAGSTSST